MDAKTELAQFNEATKPENFPLLFPLRLFEELKSSQVAGWGIYSLPDARIYERIVLGLWRSVCTGFEGFNLQWIWLSLHNVLKHLIFVLTEAFLVFFDAHSRWLQDYEAYSGEEFARIHTHMVAGESLSFQVWSQLMDRFRDDLIFVDFQKATTIGRSESRLSVVEFRWALLISVTWQGGWCIAIIRNQNLQKCKSFKNI